MTGRRTLGELLRAHRLAAGLTQDDLARKAGVSVRTLRNLELDGTPHPRELSVSRIAAALSLPERERRELRAAIAGGPDSAEAPGVEVSVLGPLRVHRDGTAVPVSSPKERALLGLLALQPGQTVPRAEIVDVLWGESPPRTCAELLQGHIGRLRAVLAAPGAVERRHGGYRLRTESADVDVARFDELADAARAAADPETALSAYTRALACWRGPLLADAEHRLRTHPAALAVHRRRVAAVLAAADLALDGHDAGPAVAWLEALAPEEPLHEGLHARLILALAATGRRAEALSRYATVRERLAEELGVDPGPELAGAHVRVLRGEPRTAAEDSGPPPATAVPAQPPATAVPAQLPAPPRGFAGREAAVARLDELLGRAAAGPSITAIVSGTAGVGKSALAVHWAHSVRDAFPDGQLHLNLRGFDPAGSALTTTEAVRSLLDALGVPPGRVPAQVDAQAALFRSLLAGRRVLLVLDNARDSDQVRPLLPGSPGCLTLITSRDRLTGLVAAEGAVPLALDLLSHDEARALLRHRLGGDRLDAEPGAATALIDLCVRLPLALVVAAAHAATKPASPLAGIAGELRDTLDSFDAGDVRTDLRAVFSWSYRALSPPAARLFRLLGLHPGPNLGVAAAAALLGAPAARVRRLLAELTSANLLDEPVHGRFAAHDLLRAYAAELAATEEPDAERRAAARRMLDHYLHTAYVAAQLFRPEREPIPLTAVRPESAPEAVGDRDAALAWFAAERRALTALAAGEDGFDMHVVELAWCLTDFLEMQGHWRDLSGVQGFAAAAAERLGDEAAMARALRRLGLNESRLGRYADGLAAARRARDLYVHLGDRAGEAASTAELGMLHGTHGEMAEAVRYTLLAYGLYREIGDTAGEATAANNLGVGFLHLGELGPALAHALTSLELWASTGRRHVGEASSNDTIGMILQRLGEHREAIGYFTRAGELFAGFGARYAEADSLSHLAESLHALDDPDAARDAWRRAHAILTDLGHPDAEQVAARLR